MPVKKTKKTKTSTPKKRGGSTAVVGRKAKYNTPKKKKY